MDNQLLAVMGDSRNCKTRGTKLEKTNILKQDNAQFQIMDFSWIVSSIENRGGLEAENSF